MKLGLAFSSIVIALAVSSPALAFKGFYSSERNAGTPSSPYAFPDHSEVSGPGASVEEPLSSASDNSACISAIMHAERRYGLPENLLLAVGLQEAGLQKDGILTIWPWTINSQGIGHRFDTKEEAINFAEDEIRSGRTSFDVGCMQINMRWHGNAFSNLREAFDPIANVEYSARFLRDLRSETKDWITAAGNYHSKTPQHHARYVDGILRNLTVAERHASAFRSLALNSPAPNPKAAQMAKGGRGAQTASWWYSELSADDSYSQKRTIYSQQDIEPVLPHLIRTTGR